jgi:hypothetical protein
LNGENERKAAHHQITPHPSIQSIHLLMPDAGLFGQRFFNPFGQRGKE